MRKFFILLLIMGFLANIWALERTQRISFDFIKSKPQEVFDLIEGQEEYINNHLEDARRCRGSVECHELMLHLTSQALVSFMELKNHPRLAELKSVDISPWWSVFGFFTKNAYERYMELEGRIEKDLIVLVNLNPAAYVKIEALDGYGWGDEYQYCRTDILGAYVNYAFFSAVAYRLLHLDSKGLDNLQEEIKEVLRVFPTQKEQKNAFAALATLYKELYTIELIKIPKVDKNSLHYVNDNLIKPGIQELRSVVKALIDSELDGLMIDAGVQLAAKKMQESLLRKLLRGALNVASISNELGTYLTVYQKGISNVMENFEEIFWYLDAWSALKSCQGRLATHCLGSIEESEWYVIQRSNGEFYILPEAKPFLDKLETRWKLYHLLALSPSLAYKYVKEEASSSQSSVSSSSSSFAASSVKPLKASFEIKGKQTLYVGDEIEIISTSDKSLEHLWYIQAPSGKSMSVRNRIELRYRLKEAGRYRIVLRVSDGERSDRAEKFVDVVRPPATVTKIKNYKEWLLGSETKGVDGRKGWFAGLRREDGWCVNVGVRESNGCLNVEGEVQKINLFLIDTTDRNEPIGIAARLRRPPTIKKIRDSVLWDDYDWVGEDNYRSNETIAIRNPRQGTYYFAAYAFEDFHNAKIYFEVKTIQKEQVLQSSSSSSSSMSSSSTSSISSANFSSMSSVSSNKSSVKDLRGIWKYKYWEKKCPNTPPTQGWFKIEGEHSTITHLKAKGKNIYHCQVVDFSVDKKVSLPNDFSVIYEVAPGLSDCEWRNSDMIRCYNSYFQGTLELQRVSSQNNIEYAQNLKSFLDVQSVFKIGGYFYNYDFNHNGKIEYNDWVLVTPDGDAYRLLGVAPTQDNAFGFQPISLPKGLANKEPMGYFIYLGFSQDSDKRFSWLYVTRDGYVYKLMGANADGTFRYLDIDGNGRVDALEELKITITDSKPLSIDFASQKSVGRLTSQTSQIEQTPLNPIEKYIGNWKGTSKVWLINQPNVYCIWQWNVRIDANKKGSLSARLIERRNDQGYCATSGYAAFEITNVSDYGFSYRLTQTSTSVFGGSERGYFQVMNNNSVKEEKSMNIAGYPAKRLSILYKQ